MHKDTLIIYIIFTLIIIFSLINKVLLQKKIHPYNVIKYYFFELDKKIKDIEIPKL